MPLHDAETHKGMALLFRFDSPNATQTVSLRGLSASTTYRLTDVTPTEASFVVGEFSGADLMDGIPVTIAQTRGVRVLTIDPA